MFRTFKTPFSYNGYHSNGPTTKLPLLRSRQRYQFKKDAFKRLFYVRTQYELE